jgi:hypothetical protein
MVGATTSPGLGKWAAAMAASELRPRWPQRAGDNHGGERAVTLVASMSGQRRVSNDRCIHVEE